jgi:hypothetical protein
MIETSARKSETYSRRAATKAHGRLEQVLQELSFGPDLPAGDLSLSTSCGAGTPTGYPKRDCTRPVLLAEPTERHHDGRIVRWLADAGPGDVGQRVGLLHRDGEAIDQPIVFGLSLDPPRKSDGCFAAFAGW